MNDNLIRCKWQLANNIDFHLKLDESPVFKQFASKEMESKKRSKVIFILPLFSSKLIRSKIWMCKITRKVNHAHEYWCTASYDANWWSSTKLEKSSKFQFFYPEKLINRSNRYYSKNEDSDWLAKAKWIRKWVIMVHVILNLNELIIRSDKFWQ